MKQSNKFIASFIMINHQPIFEQVLGLKEPWYIKSIDFSHDAKRMDIYIEFRRGATFEHIDEKTGQVTQHKAYDTIEKTYRHLNFFQCECLLHVKTPRIKPIDNTIRLISPDWIGLSNGFTLYFEAFLLELCMHMPVTQVAKMTQTTDYKIWAMLERYVMRALSLQNLSDLTAVGFDETAVAKGHQYVTLFVDMLRRNVVFVTDGKDNTTVIAFVKHLQKQGGAPDKIMDVSIDMSPAFIKGTVENLPNAQITFDKFHVVKVLNEAVDKTRKEEQKTQPCLKGSRYALLKNDKNLTAKQKKCKEKIMLSQLNLKSLKAMHLRENFQEIYKAQTPEEFEKYLKKWYFWATHSRLEHMIRAAKTIKDHWAGVLRYRESKISNGILEGLNSIIQAAKRKARGYKSKHFQVMIYLIAGRLNYGHFNKHLLPT